MEKYKVLSGYQIVSFDVTSHFADVSLDETIDIILQRIYIDKEINP